MMSLFHLGDCDALADFPADRRLRREERALVGSLLAELDDARGREMFLHAFPIDDQVLPDTRKQLEHVEGCVPTRCFNEGDAACKPWFGREAPGSCVDVRYGTVPGCMPNYCRDAYELLAGAVEEEWPNADRILLKTLALADGSSWGTLCHCGIRAGFLSVDHWVNIAATDSERTVLQRCLADAPNNVVSPCRRARKGGLARTCGQVTRMASDQSAGSRGKRAAAAPESVPGSVSKGK